MCVSFAFGLPGNDFRFRSLQPVAIPVIKSVKARVKFHLTVFFKQQRTARGRRFFTRRWGGGGATVSLHLLLVVILLLPPIFFLIFIFSVYPLVLVLCTFVPLMSSFSCL